MIFVLYLLSAYLLLLVELRCCNKFAGWKCQECPQDTHLYKGHCLFNTPHCKDYKDGFDCVSCEEGYSLNSNQECQKKVNENISQQSSKETILDLQNLNGDKQMAFYIAKDLAKSLHSELKNATVIGALYRQFQKGKDQIVMEFSINQQYKQIVYQANVKTFIFQQKSYQTIEAPSIIKKEQPKPIKEDQEEENKKIIYVKKVKDQVKQNIYFKVVKDFLQRQKPGMKIIQISSFEDPQNSYFKLIIQVNQNKEEIETKIDKNKFLVSVEKEVKLTDKKQVSKYELIELKKIFEDIFFIMVRDFISKEFNNKFKNHQIEQVLKLQDQQNIQYKVQFGLQSQKEQVQVKINKNDFKITLISEKKPVEVQRPKVSFDDRKLGSNILDQANGFYRMKETDIKNDSNFKKVSKLLLQLNPEELNNAELEAVFGKMKGLTISYKIYYMRKKTIYEGHVSYDLIRRKSYIISFGKLGY